MFSEKYGYKAEKQIQHECISDVLRRRIWNLFYQWEIQDGGLSSPRINLAFQGKQTIEEKVCDRLGFVVNASVKGLNAQGKIEKYLTKDCEWYEVLILWIFTWRLLMKRKKRSEPNSTTNYLNKKRLDIELLPEKLPQSQTKLKFRRLSWLLSHRIRL